MTTFPFRPGRDFAILRREMDRLFDDATAGDRSSAQTVWSPRADVAEADDAYFLTLDLPGIDRDALDVTFDDGTPSTIDQQAKDVAAFLAWAAEPKMEERKAFGFGAMIYLVIFAGLLYASYRRIWRNVAH